MNRILVAFVCSAFSFVLFFPTLAGGAVLSVRPDGTGEYPTLRAAITAAQPGDTIQLEDGTFLGPDNHNLVLLGKRLLFRSQSGDPTRSIIDCTTPNAYAERAFRFVLGDSATVQGLTMTNGLCVGNGEDRQGAGIKCDGNASPIIENCIFSYNTARIGAGASISPGCFPVFTNCVFESNTAVEGGPAMDVWGFSRPTFTGCLFKDNISSFDGGAVEVGTDAMPHFVDCEFTGNYAEGGGCIKNYGAPLFTRCVFHDNSVVSQGGVIWNMMYSDPVFEYCLFYDNSPNWGAVAYTLGPITFRNCTLFRNNSYDGAIRAEPTAFITLDHTVVAFQDRGAPVWCSNGTALATCCDFYKNQGGDWRYCVQDQHNGEDNIEIDPLFCDAEHFDFHLSPDSPLANNPYCELIGAFPVGCSSSQVAENGPAGVNPGLRITPNPAGGSCSVSWLAPSAGPATIELYSVTGRRVRSIRGLAAGTRAVRWDGLDDAGHPVPAGAYLVRVTVDAPSATTTATGRVVVTR